MNIDSEEKLLEIIEKVLDFYPTFENELGDWDENDQVSERSESIQDFLVDHLKDGFDSLKELQDNIECIDTPKKRFGSYKKKLFSDKLLVFLYSIIVRSCKTEKVKGILVSKRSIENLNGIRQEGYVIHHSHITDEIIGYAHPYCNENIKENYCKTPVVAHSLFNFDFFFLLKGLRSGVWKTHIINIGGRNTSNINFASIGNQIHFLDTIKYF